MKIFLVNIYTNNGCQKMEIRNVYKEDAEYFLENDIKVSMEYLAGDYIVYGCPYADESEESEVTIFAMGRSCEDTLHDLAETCRRIK